ncbi:MAG: hypothetical protein MPK62_05555, partial [Alphaproteobacteria bacterium]|nr:hypothetical protein [Alphaproteobacteria bacterium]
GVGLLGAGDVGNEDGDDKDGDKGRTTKTRAAFCRLPKDGNRSRTTKMRALFCRLSNRLSAHDPGHAPLRDCIPPSAASAEPR